MSTEIHFPCDITATQIIHACQQAIACSGGFVVGGIPRSPEVFLFLLEVRSGHGSISGHQLRPWFPPLCPIERAQKPSMTISTGSVPHVSLELDASYPFRIASSTAEGSPLSNDGETTLGNAGRPHALVRFAGNPAAGFLLGFAPACAFRCGAYVVCGR